MMHGRMGALPIATENPLGLSWHDTVWIPILNPSNIMDYFSERSNPFFDRTCNNEMVKMQRLNPDQLNNMTGLEYILLHVQEPILYVIRKQHRHTPTQATPLADYYIIAGTVYQAPDLASVLNSRLLSAVHHLQSSFEETASFSRYHPSKGYSWDFKPNKPGVDRNVANNSPSGQSNVVKETPAISKEEPSTPFQRQRVDMLLAELVRQFPLPTTQQPDTKPAVNNAIVKTENNADKTLDVKPDISSININIKQEPGEASTTNSTNASAVANGPSSGSNIKQEAPEIKRESMKPPPEKKPRLN